MSQTGFDLDEVTIADVQRGIRDGETTSTEMVESYLGRIEAVDRSGPELNSILAVNDSALERAAELDRSFAESGQLVGPLHGVTVVVKDNILTDDMPATCGSITMVGYRPSFDAAVVKRMREAGAIILAKTTMPDWATSWFSFSSLSTTTRAPYDTGTDPGGSSSGTGSAVAANLAVIGLGTDCGGSVRVPSSNCNLVGVRGTPGLIPRTGSSYLVLPQDTIGPMARTVTDAAILTDLIAGYDAGDPYSVASRAGSGLPKISEQLDADSLEGVRLGLVTNAFGSEDEPQMAAVKDLILTAVEELRAAGATVVEVEIPDLFDQLVATSAYTQRSRHDLDLFLSQLGDTPVKSMAEVYDTKRYPPECDLIDSMSEGFEDPESEADYLKTFLARHEFALCVNNVMAAADVRALVYPTIQIPPQRLEDRVNWDTLTYPTNTLIASQTWLPALTVPAGFVDESLPVGLELLGRPFDEPALFSFAYAFEQRTHHRRPPTF
jgi:amidase